MYLLFRKFPAFLIAAAKKTRCHSEACTYNLCIQLYRLLDPPTHRRELPNLCPMVYMELEAMRELEEHEHDRV